MYAGDTPSGSIRKLAGKGNFMERYRDFADLVDGMAADEPGRVALLACDAKGAVQPITWSDFAARVAARAEELAAGGCLCEAVLADATPACIVEVFAAVRAGLQVALLDPLMPNQMLVPLLQTVDADCVWAGNAGRRDELAQKLDPRRQPANGAHAMLFFTSGTTSASKPVVLTDASLMACAYNGAAVMPLSPDDTLLCLLPLSHVFGFVCGLLWGLSCGATVALGRGARHYAQDPAFFRPTAISAVPRLLEFLVAAKALNAELRLVLVGAADCPESLLDEVRARGIRASLGYGLTETSSGVALSTGDDFHALTVCPEDQVEIAQDGEILVSSASCLMQGYYRDERKTAAVLQDGVLHTGDKGYLDERGRLHVQGRIKDVIALPNGTKVFLPEYEAAVSAALDERDVAVALRDGRLVLVCGRMAHDRTDGEILEALAPAMAAFPPASRITGIENLGAPLPRTAAGDIERWKISLPQL